MSIKFYGKSQEVCESILETFKSGNLPEALKPVFIHRHDEIPSTKWSWSNRFVQAIRGTTDARGFRQWQEAGRKVKKGAKAFHILGPCLKTGKRENEETGEEEAYQFLVGFRSIPVFRIEDTEVFDPELWESQGGVDLAEENRLKTLPLYGVAQKWGLTVTSYNGRDKGYLGYYASGAAIAVGVENLSTWTHELTHAADDMNGTITKKAGQQPDNEIVAELGGAVLLKIMGYDTEADLGGAWKYIQNYAGGDQEKAVRKAMQLIDRICSCVDRILAEADTIEEELQAA